MSLSGKVSILSPTITAPPLSDGRRGPENSAVSFGGMTPVFFHPNTFHCHEVTHWNCGAFGVHVCSSVAQKGNAAALLLHVWLLFFGLRVGSN